MTTHPKTVRQEDHLRWQAVPAEPRDAKRGSSRRGGNDLMLVLGVAAVALGVATVSRSVLPAPSAAHSVSSPQATLGRVEMLVPASDDRPVATMPQADQVTATPETRTASSGATTGVTACAPRLHLDHDLRLVLLAMALQRRRTLHATGHYVPPDKQDVPASVLARTKGAVARAEVSPPAARQATSPGC